MELQKSMQRQIKDSLSAKLSRRVSGTHNQRPKSPTLYLQDNRTYQRKPRLTEKFTHDSVKLRDHHFKSSKKIHLEVLLTLNKMLELELELESLRRDLVLRPDFIVAQLFSYFDVTCKSKISLLEVYNGLFDLGITANKEDLIIAIKEFDTKSRSYLSYEDLFRLVAPQDKQFRKVLVDRHKNCEVQNFQEVKLPNSPFFTF